MQMAGECIRAGRSLRRKKCNPIVFERKTMLIIRAEGNLPGQVASWEIKPGQTLTLGRSRHNDCSVPWDPRVSGNTPP